MPSVPRYDAPEVAPQPLRGGQRSTVAGGRDPGAQQSALLGDALTKIGNAGADIVRDMHRREDADVIFRAETAVKDEYLKYEQEARTQRQGRFAKDLTTDTAKWWEDQSKKASEGMTNDAQRRIFTERVTRLREQSLGAMSHYESVQLERSHDEGWLASKNSTISMAAANPTTGKSFVRNADGSVSTERTITIEADGKHVVLPSIIDGKQLSAREAIDAWKEGKNTAVGQFDSAAEAKKFAEDRTAKGGGLGSVDAARLELERANRYQAARRGWEPERLKAEILKDKTTLHKNVIESLAQRDPMSAKAYFEKHKGEIEGTLHAEIGKFAEKSTATAQGDATAEEVWKAHGPKSDRDAVSLDVLEAKVREKLKGNEEAMKLAVAGVKERSAAFAVGRRERDDATEAAVWKSYNSGAPLGQIRRQTEFLQLSPEKQTKIIEHIESQAHAKRARARAEENFEEQQRTRAGFAAYSVYSRPDNLENLTENQILALTPDLGNQLVGHLIEKKRGLGTKVLEARIDQQDFDHVAQGAGLKPFDPKKSEAERAALGELKFRIEQRIDAEQAKAKRPLSRAEKMQVFQQEIDNKVLVDEWGRDPVKPLVLLKDDELKNAYVLVDGQRVDVAKIPREDREEIIKLRQARSLPVTEQAIAQTWIAKKNKKITATVDPAKAVPQ